jgi:hypothetical protein
MSEYKLVNPDIMLSGATRNQERAFSIKPAVYKDGVPNLDYNCPYDGTYCRQKDYKVAKWTDAVEYMASHQVNNTFITSATIFHECPLAGGVQCIRKIRYDNIVRVMKHKQLERVK